MQEQAIVITKVHRFDYYDSDWESMNRRLRVASLLTARNEYYTHLAQFNTTY
jgi:hypothetical protein